MEYNSLNILIINGTNNKVCHFHIFIFYIQTMKNASAVDVLMVGSIVICLNDGYLVHIV